MSSTSVPEFSKTHTGKPIITVTSSFPFFQEAFQEINFNQKIK